MTRWFSDSMYTIHILSDIPIYICRANLITKLCISDFSVRQCLNQFLIILFATTIGKKVKKQKNEFCELVIHTGNSHCYRFKRPKPKCSNACLMNGTFRFSWYTTGMYCTYTYIYKMYLVILIMCLAILVSIIFSSLNIKFVNFEFYYATINFLFERLECVYLNVYIYIYKNLVDLFQNN